MTSRTHHVWMGLLLVVGACGCQCCLLFDPYADAVDCVADHEHHLDRLYRPWYDLTRIGRPDWCQCGLNRAICPCACQRRKPLPHIVDTISPQHRRDRADEPSPAEPAYGPSPAEPADERGPAESADEPSPAEPVDEPPIDDAPPDDREPPRIDRAPALFRLESD